MRGTYVPLIPPSYLASGQMKMQLVPASLLTKFYSFDQFIKYFGVYLVVDEKQFLHESLISTTKGVCEASSILFIVVFRQKYSQIQAQIEILQSMPSLLYDWQTHGMMLMLSKKSIDIFNYKQRVLSLDMKTKIVQHVLRINLSHFKF